MPEFGDSQEGRFPSEREQQLAIAKEMWDTRTPKLLDGKVLDYMEIQGPPSLELRGIYEKERGNLVELFGDPDSGLKLIYCIMGLVCINMMAISIAMVWIHKKLFRLQKKFCGKAYSHTTTNGCRPRT